jgi:hypothetical protein
MIYFDCKRSDKFIKAGQYKSSGSPDREDDTEYILRL